MPLTSTGFKIIAATDKTSVTFLALRKSGQIVPRAQLSFLRNTSAILSLILLSLSLSLSLSLVPSNQNASSWTSQSRRCAIWRNPKISLPSSDGLFRLARFTYARRATVSGAYAVRHLDRISCRVRITRFDRGTRNIPLARRARLLSRDPFRPSILPLSLSLDRSIAEIHSGDYRARKNISFAD